VPIVDVKGRPRSVLDEDEELRRIIEDIEKLPPEEQQALKEVYAGLIVGEEEDFEALASEEYERAPVDIVTFLSDPYFLGETGGSLYDVLKDDIVELFTGDHHEAILGGSLGWGKSFFSTTAMAYILYQISCLKSPQKAYGIDPGSHLYIAMLSVTEKVAKRVVINELIGKLTYSRYFKEKFPFKPAPSQLEVRFPNAVQAVAGSTASSAIIGLNVFSGFIDETSFMGEAKALDRAGREVAIDQGEAIYKSIIRRMKSRFQKVGRLPGLLIMASSKERPAAFIEKRIAEVRELATPGVFVREYATWDVKPEGTFSEGTFKVLVGNERVQSRILSDDPEEEKRYRDMDLRIIDVPEDYRPDFINDIDGAIRDIAGVATDAVSQYMNRTEKLYDSQDSTLVNPCGYEDGGDVLETWCPDQPLPIQWHSIAQQYNKRLPGGFSEVAWRPLRHPQAARYVHIDPALTGDAAGLCIAHVAGWTEVVRRDAKGEEYNELAPRIEADLVLGVIPPPGDEIMLSDLRAVVYQFIEHGFVISYASLDSFQSVDTIQQFKKHGIEAEVVSVDKTTEPYDTYKAAIYEDRWRCYPHSILHRELRNLQRVPTGGKFKKIKVDHPKKNSDGTPGSKDVSDSCAGVTYSLTQRAPGRPMGIIRSEREGFDEKVDDSWVTDGAVMVQSPGKTGGARGIVGGHGPRKGPPLPFVKG
jgi:hypothetical protein